MLNTRILMGVCCCCCFILVDIKQVKEEKNLCPHSQKNGN